MKKWYKISAYTVECENCGEDLEYDEIDNEKSNCELVDMEDGVGIGLACKCGHITYCQWQNIDTEYE